ncbi:MAG: tripartite tricarboxylate transporter substrate binding protein [Betaproteobacteria bacterium]|nr:tripartite tricarboxylate transporter substrate binding protein [Betaproteobacteria bacterium]
MTRILTSFLLALTLAAAAQSQDYPTKPIRVLVPYAPGGVVDTSTRILTNKIAERLGWQFVVDNRTGGNGFIAVSIAARGAPDGYTLLSAHTGEFAVSPFVFKDVPFELDRDFTAVIMLSDAPMIVVVNSRSPINSFKDLVAAAKVKPGQLSFGSPGSGSVNHVATEWLAVAAGIKMLHVPYRGGAPAVSAVAANEVVMTIAGLPGVIPHLQAKRVKVIGITTAKRSPQVPDYPTPQEGGIPGVDASIWVGLFAPKGTPKTIVNKLYSVSAEMLKFPDVKERYGVVGGAETIGMPPAEFHARVKQDAERYKKIVKAVGIEPQ